MTRYHFLNDSIGAVSAVVYTVYKTIKIGESEKMDKLLKVMGVGVTLIWLGIVTSFGVKDGSIYKAYEPVSGSCGVNNKNVDLTAALRRSIEIGRRVLEFCSFIRTEIDVSGICATHKALEQRALDLGFSSLEECLTIYGVDESDGDESESSSSAESDDETSITVRSPARGVAVRKQSPAAMSNK